MAAMQSCNRTRALPHPLRPAARCVLEKVHASPKAQPALRALVRTTSCIVSRGLLRAEEVRRGVSCEFAGKPGSLLACLSAQRCRPRQELPDVDSLTELCQKLRRGAQCSRRGEGSVLSGLLEQCPPRAAEAARGRALKQRARLFYRDAVYPHSGRVRRFALRLHIAECCVFLFPYRPHRAACQTATYGSCSWHCSAPFPLSRRARGAGWARLPRRCTL